MQANAYDLYSLGWTPELSRAYSQYRARGLVPARVSAQRRGELALYSTHGDLSAGLAGRLRRALSPAGLPVAGDWVAARLAAGGGRAVVEAVLPRLSVFTRAASDMTRPGSAVQAQVVAANIDVALVVADADGDLNARRLERYLAAAWESGARPAVLVTKVDLVPDPAGAVRIARAVAPGVEVVAVSNVTGEGVEAVRGLLAPGRTAVLLGSSGVGKSTLVNRLAGSDRQKVAATRPDGRGRHTTTHRELFLLPESGLVLDTPGMRSLKPWDDAGLDYVFADIEEAAAGCRFRDCRHGSEPGCAVRGAVDRGALASDRVAAYERLRREVAFLERRGDKRAQAEQRRRCRADHRELRRRERPAR